jgi:threonine/homoserine/homoserine lactone efflux protein
VAGMVSVLGIGSGCVVHILAATIGLYSLLALSPFAFTAICLAGGTYLIYLGIMTVISGNNTRPAFTFGDTPEAKWQIYRQGMLTNLLNPKVALFFLAFLPQFIDPVSNLGWLSFLFLGLIFFCTGTIWCLFVALSASTIADRFRDDIKIQRGFDYFTCILFVGLGISVLLTHF